MHSQLKEDLLISIESTSRIWSFYLPFLVLYGGAISLFFSLLEGRARIGSKVFRNGTRILYVEC